MYIQININVIIYICIYVLYIHINIYIYEKIKFGINPLFSFYTFVTVYVSFRRSICILCLVKTRACDTVSTLLLLFITHRVQVYFLLMCKG